MIPPRPDGAHPLSTENPATATAPTALWVVPAAIDARVTRHVLDVAQVGLPGWNLAITAPKGPLLERLRELRTPVIPLPVEFGSATAVRSLRITVQRLRPQIVHSHLAKADFLAAIATAGLPVKLISTEHLIAPDRYLFHPNHAEARLVEAAHRLRLTRFSRVIAVSASTKRDMTDRWKTRTPITVVLNGVDRPDPVPEREPGLRFLSLTRLVPEENVDMTLRAFALIAAQHPDARLTVGGQGPESTRLRILAGRLGVFGSIDFLESIEADEAMASHDVILQPSRSDNCSYTLLDAAAHGMGVAASPTGGNAEILPLRSIAALDDDAGFARVAVEQALNPSARPVLGPQVPTVAGMTERIVGEYETALGTHPHDEVAPAAPESARAKAPLPANAGDNDRPLASGPVPEVSVVIAYYKEPDLLARQLNALSLQESAPQFEVVIADNEGSSLLSDVVRPFHNALDVHTIDASDRSGQDHARNQGVAAARGTLIALCDQDDIVSPGWLAALAAPLRESDVLVTGPLRLDRINSRVSWLTGQGLDANADHPSPVLSVPVTYLDYLPVAIGCNIGMRRSTFLALGGFDETLPGDEDSDLTWRSIESGIPLQVEPAALVDYRLRSTARRVFHQRRTYMIYQAAFWVRSKRLGRPIRGMSFRWTATETLRLAPAGLYSLVSGPDERYAFAAHAGNILGNLQGQLQYRIIPRLPRIISSTRRRKTK